MLLLRPWAAIVPCCSVCLPGHICDKYSWLEPMKRGFERAGQRVGALLLLVGTATARVFCTKKGRNIAV